MISKLLIPALALLMTSCAVNRPRQTIPPPGKFGLWHPAAEDFQQMLAGRASRQVVERDLVAGWQTTLHPIVSKTQFLAIPPGMPPSERALILIKHWPNAIYAPLVDDVRVLACFDSNNRLVAYELF